ncbi:MAG: DASH complex subunit ask1 [Vezdaea aestivalis]|nr:MAG: DASH complex subunit ask1 [Vezdaea aestivalis]
MSNSQRNLSLTEELEKLDQSITLTLQEIDHNFSRAHRIVTSSILPIIEQYATHSQAVWEGSKFWKQFFEASANVSLSGYEELATTTNPASPDESTTELTISTTPTPSQLDSSLTPTTQTPISKTTPRPNISNTYPPTQHSPYQILRAQTLGSSPPAPLPNDDFDDPPSPTPTPTTTLLSPPQQPKDPLLHRALDSTYRIAATPLRTERPLQPSHRLPQRPQADLLLSSPDLPPPSLDPELFSSPLRRRPIPSPGPRTPGVSVLASKQLESKHAAPRGASPFRTPRRGGFLGADDNGDAADTLDSSALDAEANQLTLRNGGAVGGFESESDGEDDSELGFPAGMSPPKTMQFHIPRAQVLRTPAREASKRIVEDLLINAGLGGREDDTSEFE